MIRSRRILGIAASAGLPLALALVAAPLGSAAPFAAGAAARPAAPAARQIDAASLWGYVDAAGTARFAARQVDSRYARILGDAGSLRVRGKTQGTGGLLTWLEISPDVKRMQPLLTEAARSTGVDEELLKAVITVESGFNADAVSPRGAVGLMQLTPDAAERYATPAERRRPAAERMRDAATNIRIGARMLADLTRRYGGVDVALAAWNAGEGTVRRSGGRMPAIAETEAHVHQVLEIYWALMQRRTPAHVRRVELVS